MFAASGNPTSVDVPMIQSKHGYFPILTLN